MNALTLIILLILLFFAFYIEQLWVTEIIVLLILFILMVWILKALFFTGKATASFFSKDVMKEMEEHEPKGIKGKDVIQMGKDLSTKVSEGFFATSDYRYRSDKLAKRTGKGAQNLFDALKKLFVK